MAVHQYDPLLAPLKKAGVIKDYLFSSESGWTGSDAPPLKTFMAIVSSDVDAEEVQRKVDEAVAGHPYSVAVQKENDLHIQTSGDDDFYIIIRMLSERGKGWMEAYTRDIKPHPLEIRNVKWNLNYEDQWVQKKTDNLEYLELMLETAKDYGLNVTGNLPKQ